MRPAFCILAAGRGSRLGELTSSVNKALLPITNKAAITHIIDKVPLECDVIVAVGYQREKVVEYCLAAHPERRIVFVEVDNLDGPSSGPAYSLSCCEPHLQRPFYVCNVDTLFADKLPSLNRNWMGVSKIADADKKNYATVLTHTVEKGRYLITSIHDKIPEGSNLAYIGIMGIVDFSLFWDYLHMSMTNQNEQQYISAFTKTSLETLHMETAVFEWFDTGSVQGYKDTCKHFGNPETLGMEKCINEFTYCVGNRIIKLCWDSAKNKRRIRRRYLLVDKTPTSVFEGEYVYAYEWIGGKTLYKVNDLGVYVRFLDWCDKKLWDNDYTKSVPNFDEICRHFYCDKTWDRLNAYLSKKGLEHAPSLMINGLSCEPVDAYLTYIDWHSLCRGTAVAFHGDLQFDNVILSDEGPFKLIDWRDSFGDSPLYGDIYYDLGKLYSGMDLPYDRLKEGWFEVRVEEDGKVVYEYELPSELHSARQLFESWLSVRGFNIDKVRMISALIHLNMSPLHPGKLGDLLFYHANLTLAILSTHRRHQ